MFAVGLVASFAKADDSALASWDMPADCGDAAAFVARTGADAGVVARLAVRLHALPSEGGFTAQLSLSREGGVDERRLSGAHCDEVLSAASVVVAVAADGLSHAERTDETSPAEAPSSPAPTNRTAPASEVAPSTDIAEAASRIGIAVRAGAALDYGGLARAALGLRAELGVRYGPWRFWGGIYGLPPRTVVDERGAGGEFALVVGALRAGYALEWSRFGFEFSAGVDLGGFFSRGVGISEPASSVAFWGAGVVGVGFALGVVSGFALRIDAEGGVPMVRRSFSVGALPFVGAPVAFVRVSAGVMWTFP